MPEMRSQISAVWDKHPDWATICASLVVGVPQAARCGLP